MRHGAHPIFNDGVERPRRLCAAAATRLHRRQRPTGSLRLRVYLTVHYGRPPTVFLVQLVVCLLACRVLGRIPTGTGVLRRRQHLTGSRPLVISRYPRSLEN